VLTAHPDSVGLSANYYHQYMWCKLRNAL
jgi:hypothetical protein